MPTVAYVLGSDGRVEYVNDAWHQLTGVPRSAILADAWAAIVHPDDLPAVAADLQAALENRAGFAIRVRARVQNGGYRWMVSTAAPRECSDGAVRWFGSVFDIDDHVQAEDAAQAARALAEDRRRTFEALAEAIPQILWTADATGSIDWYNHGWYDYTGQTAEEAAGWGWQDVHHPEDFPAVMREWPASIASGRSFEMEFRLRGRDGLFRWFLTRVEPLRDESGTIVRWYGTNTDIDAQRRDADRTRRIAETMQDVFLPKTFPRFDNLWFDTDYVAAGKDALVGGDWFDAFELPDGRVAFSIGDVAGHGLGASVTVGRVRQAIFTLAFEYDDPAVILSRVNRVLRAQGDPFVTAVVGVMDRTSRTIRWASAGHPAPILFTAGGARLLPHGGLPLGILDDASFAAHEIVAEHDDAIMLYTDGLIEFERDVITAERSLLAAASRTLGSRTASPARAIRELMLGTGSPTDDIAILIGRFGEPTAVESDVAGTLWWRFHSSDAASARRSRAELVSYLARAAPKANLFTAELILGELLANTVEHAPGLVEIQITWDGDRPVATFRDSGAGFIATKAGLPADPLSEDGRGLFLVQTLAEEFSMRELPGYGTEIRVVLPISRI